MSLFYLSLTTRDSLVQKQNTKKMSDPRNMADKVFANNDRKNKTSALNQKYKKNFTHMIPLYLSLYRSPLHITHCRYSKLRTLSSLLHRATMLRTDEAF